MAWISSTTAIYAHCSLLFTFAFILARDPSQLTEHPLVVVIGQAMMLRPSSFLSTTNNNKNTNADQSVPLLILLVSLLGSTDLIQLSLRNMKYFESIIPTRLTICFLLSGWSYVVSSSALHNDLCFVFLFVEMWFHFVLYNFVRQEKDERKRKYKEMLEKEILAAHEGGVDMEELARTLPQPPSDLLDI